MDVTILYGVDPDSEDNTGTVWDRKVAAYNAAFRTNDARFEWVDKNVVELRFTTLTLPTVEMLVAAEQRSTLPEDTIMVDMTAVSVDDTEILTDVMPL